MLWPVLSCFPEPSPPICLPSRDPVSDSVCCNAFLLSINLIIIFKLKISFFLNVHQAISQVAVHRELERVTLALAECLPVEWPSRVLSTEDRLSPVAPVPHSKISSLAKQRPRAVALDSALENDEKITNNFYCLHILLLVPFIASFAAQKKLFFFC